MEGQKHDEMSKTSSGYFRALVSQQDCKARLRIIFYYPFLLSLLPSFNISPFACACSCVPVFCSLHLFYVTLLLLLKAQDPVPSDGQVKNVQLEIKDDDLPEPDEQVLVYLTDATGGARVATDSDSGLQVSFTWR